MRVFVIGRHPDPSKLPITSNAHIESVAANMLSRRTLSVRCDSPHDLVDIVRDAAADRPIDRLDLFDHGRAGAQALGEGILFQSDADPNTELMGADIARQIKPYMSETAQVRLLGCRTAEATKGRLLLIKLARILEGHRVVFGVIDQVTQYDFDPDGYRPVMEQQRLFSSYAALDGIAPTAIDRFHLIREVRKAS
jgi:hypothetical protein